MAKKLSAQQKAFVQALTGEAKGNQTHAAILAGYSPRSATQTASRLITVDKVAEAVAARVQKLEEKVDLSDERILKETADVAYTQGLALRGSDKVKALSLLMAFKGLTQTEPQQQNRVTVNIGFLTPPETLKRIP